MEFKTFSCYDNFVPGNNCGAPEHTPTHYALQHLERLLQATSQRVRQLTQQQMAVGRSPTPVSPHPPPEVKPEDANPEPSTSKGNKQFFSIFLTNLSCNYSIWEIYRQIMFSPEFYNG